MSKKDDFFAKLAVSKRIIDKHDEIPRADVSGNRPMRQPQRQQAPVPTPTPTPRTNTNQPSYKNLSTSKMPDFIKEAMVQNPIIDQPVGSAFSMSDIPQEFMQQQHQNITETIQPNINPSAMVGLTESEVRDIVRDEMSNFFVDYFKETIKEQTEKNLIKDMINKGIIKRKKK